MQYNINVANGTGMEVRTNLNLAHQSLATNFFGATDPSLMSPVCAFPGSTWADTGNGLLKVRNADDSDWIVIGTIESDGTPKLNASGINNTPSGTISATNVQSAVNSLNVLPLLLRDTAYAEDDVAFYAGLPSAMYLQCTTAGTTDTVNITIPSPVAVGDTITDGTVEWTVKKLGSGSGSGRTVGDIFLHAGNGENPQGALLCDGSEVSRTMYPDLFAKIGTTYGAGDGATTFNLPNLSDNRFVEGSTTAGTSHAAGLPNITGTWNITRVRGGLAATGAVYSVGEVAPDSDYTSGGAGLKVGFNASLSSPVYGNSDTVQPKSLTLRYFIQAFDGQTPDSALIDITQYAQELANKANRDLSNLTQTGQDSFLERDFTIIYPNGGTEANPANITNNSRYVEANPYPNYDVYCELEVLYNGVWGGVSWSNYGNTYYVGAKAFFYNGNIVIQTANNSITGTSNIYGNPFAIPTGDIKTIPCRVKVWKIGKISS